MVKRYKKIDWDKLDTDWKLCYVYENCEDEWRYLDRHKSLKVFYSKLDPHVIWGDDWDDPEYGSNSGFPYTHRTIEKPVIKGNPDLEIEYLVLDLVYFKAYTPNDFSDLKVVSVENINKDRLVPWLIVPDKSLYAGSSPQDLKEALEGERYLLDIDDKIL